MPLEARSDDPTAASAPEALPQPRRPRPLAILFALPLAAIFLAVFLVRFDPAAASLGRIVEPVVAAAVVLFAAYACGAAALAGARLVFRRVTGLDDDGEAIGHSAQLMVGLPVFGTLVAVVAWVGFAIQLSVSLVALVLGVAGVLHFLRRRPRLGNPGAWDVALLGPPIALAIIGALSPVNSPDELVYKLAVPRAYLLFGAMIDLPLNSYSYVSTALSHVSLAALALSGGIAAKVAHCALFVATVLTLRRLGEELHPGSGPWVAAVVAWSPALLLIAGWAWVEWGLLGLLLLSYRGWLAFERRPSAAAAAVITTALAGAAAVKYTALPWIGVFAVVAGLRLARPAHGPRGGTREVTRLLVAATLVVLVLGGFFYARNWSWSGSPVAPFLLDDAPEVERYRSQGALSGWQELLLGYDIVHRGIVDDALGILLPVCALVAIAGGWRRRDARDLLLIGLVPLPLLVALAPTSRLMLTSLVPLGVVGAAVLARSWTAITEPLVRGAVAAMAAVALAAQMTLVVWILVTSHDPLPVLLGAESDGAYQGRMRPYTAAYRWLHDNTPLRARVLLIGENRSFALERPVFAAGNFDGSRLAAFLGRFDGAPAFARALRSLGVTHVVVHWPWVRVEGRSGGPPGMLEREYVLPLPASTAHMLQDFVDGVATRRFQDEAYSIYEVPLR